MTTNWLTTEVWYPRAPLGSVVLGISADPPCETPGGSLYTSWIVATQFEKIDGAGEVVTTTFILITPVPVVTTTVPEVNVQLYPLTQDTVAPVPEFVPTANETGCDPLKIAPWTVPAI